jgi:uncharacterized protein YjgD (DUF1641 family)
MANPITKIKRMECSQADKEEQNLADVTKAVSENKEAILKGIDLLAALDESGALDMGNALVKHRKDALENIVGEMNKEQYASTLENISGLFFLLGDLKVDQLSYFMEKMNEGMEEARVATTEEATSYLGLAKSLKNPEINRGITMLLGFLRGMGRN